MQGKRSAIGSLPDSIKFDYVSTSNNMGIDQQIGWNTLQDPAESRLSEYHTAPGSIMGTISQETRNLSRWNIGEPSSRNLQNRINNDERMSQNGWSSPMAASAGAGPSLEDQVYDQTGVVSRVGVNLNLNGNQISSDTSFVQASNNGSTSSVPCASSSGSGGFLVEEEDNRPDYVLEGRRLSCKRKSIEGQSSSSGSMWQSLPPPSNTRSGTLNAFTRLGTSRGVSTPEPANSRLRLSIGGVAPDSIHAPNMGVGAETSRRNYRVRMNPTSEQDSFPNLSVLPRVTAGHSGVPVGHRPPRYMPINPPVDLVQAENAAAPQGSVVLRLPGLHRNVQRMQRSLVFEEGDAPLQQDLNSRPVPRNISEHPMFMPSVEVRNTNGGGGLGTSRNVASSGPTWGSHHQASSSSSSSQYSRRLSEYVRRSLLSSASGLHNGSTSAHHSAPSSQEGILPTGGGAQGHGDGVPGIPYSLRTLAAGGEGRSRLVSEQIRSVLDMMRRGEGLRFEDVIALDPSVFFGMADIHDEHGDMRLDIDNMSYEELLALEERIGSVCTGLTEEKIVARLKQRKYISVTSEDQGEVEPCCICQEVYRDGEDMGALDCGHDFHAKCIKQWLGQKNSCPICKTGLAT